MRRRVRAIAFGAAALLCAGLAAAMTGGYREDIESELGVQPVSRLQQRMWRAFWR